MSICLLCDNESDMEFSTFVDGRMLTADICLKCWGTAGSDSRTALKIMLKRQGLTIPLFNLPLDIVEHWADVPLELRDDISAFLFQGVTKEKD